MATQVQDDDDFCDDQLESLLTFPAEVQEAIEQVMLFFSLYLEENAISLQLW